MSRTITAVDLFAGAGGSSTGLAQLCAERDWRLKLTAINHWDVAVATHAANHPTANHICASLESLEPTKVHQGPLDLLWASPACTHHSNARGGKPLSDQSRASAWHVVHWAEQLRPAGIVVENVPEFEHWGPLDANGLRIRSKRGETFRAWRESLESLGYAVDYRVLNAADYGEAQSRRRLFVQAKRGRAAWPLPTHARRWRAASEVLDVSLPWRSIRGLCQRTLDRIEVGVRRFGRGSDFLVQYYGSSTVASVHDPLPTVTTHDRFGLVSGNHFRMLHPRELSAAMGFPYSYCFKGTKAQWVKQVGNAVSVRTAKALCAEVL